MCKKELAVSIFKKGDLRDCNNWRGETLLPIISKIFHRMLLERIKKGIDKKLKKKSRVALDQMEIQLNRSLH